MSLRWKGGFVQLFFDPLTQGPPNDFGSLYSWGQNDNGQLGSNNLVYRSSPVQVGALTNWSQIGGGGQQFISAVRFDGTLWSMGNNTYGKLGLNDTVARSSPTQVGALTNWSKVTAGYNHCLAIKTDGTLWAWGFNNAGQLGQNNLDPYSSPVQIGALTTWSQISAGQAHSHFIKTDGTLWGVGSGSTGRLGTNNTTNYSSPVQIGALTNWSLISSVQVGTNAIKTDGTLWGWGDGGDGAVGDGTTVNRSSPVQIGTLNNWSKIASGNDGKFFSSVKTNGTLWGWGNGLSGETGSGVGQKYSSPVQIGSLTNWSNVFGTGGSFMLSIKTDGTLWTWGVNTNGQLGDGTVISKSSPIQIGSGTSWVSAGGATRSGYAIQGT